MDKITPEDKVKLIVIFICLFVIMQSGSFGDGPVDKRVTTSRHPNSYIQWERDVREDFWCSPRLDRYCEYKRSNPGFWRDSDAD